MKAIDVSDRTKKIILMTILGIQLAFSSFAATDALRDASLSRHDTDPPVACPSYMPLEAETCCTVNSGWTIANYFQSIWDEHNPACGPLWFDDPADAAQEFNLETCGLVSCAPPSKPCKRPCPDC